MAVSVLAKVGQHAGEKKNLDVYEIFVDLRKIRRNGTVNTCRRGNDAGHLANRGRKCKVLHGAPG